MKKLISLALLVIGITITGIAQKNISPELKAERKKKSIEMQMKKENTDEEGVKLIRAHEKTMKTLKSKMNELPGYGKAATDKQSLKKFREKNAKKNAEFRKHSDTEKEARKAKEDYIAGVNEEYKKAIPLAKMVK